ncbi:PhoH family protein [Acidaminobacterium chupaoyuni]
MIEQIINVERMEQIIDLFGSFDENIRLLEKEYGVNIVFRDNNLKICGEPEAVMDAETAMQGLLSLTARGEQITPQNVNYILSLIRDGQQDKLSQIGGGVVCVTAKGKAIKAKTLGQQEYLDTIEKQTITLGVGPAGTGKTYLAVAKAVVAFREKAVNRIILTRPAVEAGEKLGFLPGDLQNKVDPYLRPLYDALFEMLGAETFQRYQEKGNIEVAPLAYMRGRTLDDSFIILDEAQNTTPEQMKMFLTRMGFHSKVVITGDITQIDLPDGKLSGLKEAMRVLKDVEGIGICTLTSRDVVRHELVQRIVNAYAKYDEQKQKNRQTPKEKEKRGGGRGQFKN